MSDSEGTYGRAPRTFQQPYSAHRPVPTISAYEEQTKSYDSVTLNRNSGSSGYSSRESFADGNESDDGNYTPTASTHSHGRTPPSELEPHQHDDPDKANHHKHGPSQPVTDTDLINEQLGPVRQGSNGPNNDDEDHKKSKKSKKDDAGLKQKSRTVTDPITHLPIHIHDNTSAQLADVSQLDKLTKGSEGGNDQEKHNFLQNLVSQEVKEYESSVWNRNPLGRLHLEVAVLIFLSFTMWSMLPSHRNDRTWKTFLFHLLRSSAVGAVIGMAIGLWIKTVLVSGNIEISNSDKKKSKKDDAYSAETTLWLNNTLGAVWPLINPDLFISIIDTLEDVMQASLKAATRLPIEGISISDWGQGSEPLRIIGVRWLDQGLAGEETDGLEAEEGEFVNLELALSYKAQETGREFAKKIKNAHVFVEFWWKGGFKLPIWVDVHAFIATARVRLQLSPDPPFFTVATITLLGQPKVSISCVPLSKKFLNIMDIPIASGFVQQSIDAAVAEYVAPKSIRLELKQMLMGDDFKKDTINRGVILLTIGGARGFKNGDASKQWIRGKALKDKLERKNKNDGEDEDTSKGDAYVTVGWAKFGKPIFKTRIISGCDSPNWEETTAILVGPDELNAGERLRVQLWDSDRTSADDLLGTVEVNLHHIMHDPASARKMQHRTDKLLDMGNHTNMPGEIRWSVGYFGKTVLSEEQLGLHSKKNDDQVGESAQNILKSIDTKDNMNKHGESMQSPNESGEYSDDSIDTGKTQAANETGNTQASNIPEQNNQNLKESADAFKKDVERKAKNKIREAPDTPLRDKEIKQQAKEDLMEYVDKIMANSPPDKNYPAGILNIQIHHGTGLELEKQRNPDRGVVRSAHPGMSGMDGGEEEVREYGEDLPSTYCTIIINHIKVYKTRVKWKTPKPFFNAGTERFVRDWRNCEVIIAVRDARTHEADPLLGVIVLPLEDVFKEKSVLNEAFPLSGGIGYGKLRVSMIFRSVQAQLPQELCGWNVGTIQMKPKITASPGTPSTLYTCKLVIRTPNGKGKLSPTSGSSEHTVSCWERKQGKDFFLPVKRRYSSYLLIEFHKDHVALDDILDPHAISAFCILWLKDIPDFNGHGDENDGNTWLNLKLPIWSTLEESKGPTKDLINRAMKSTDESYGTGVGHLEVQLRFLPGLSGYHAKLSGKDEHMEDVLEVLDCASEAHEVSKDVEGGNYQSDGDTSSTSSSDSESDEGEGGDGYGAGDENADGTTSKRKKVMKKLEISGKRDPLSDLKEYNQKKSQLHRHHRGMMQWKSVRTMKWMKDELKYKGKDMKDAVKGKLKHDGGKNAGREEVETEV